MSWRCCRGSALEIVFAAKQPVIVMQASRWRSPRVEQFARDHREFVSAVRKFVPNARARGVSVKFFPALHHAVMAADSNALFLMLDALRPFLDPSKSTDASKFWDALVADCADVAQERLRSGQIRTVWGVTPIVNLRSGVAADRMLGFEADSLIFNQFYISANFDVVLSAVQDRIVAERSGDTYLFRWLVLIWALKRYDVFHLFNDRGIIEPAGGYGSPLFGISIQEMDIYRRAGKLLFTYAYGADHRLRNKTLRLGKWTFCTECPEPGKFCVCDDVGGGKMLATIRSYATAMIAHGLSMEIIPGARNIPYIGVDIDDFAEAKRHKPRSDTSLRVGHFPNHEYFKGSKYLRQAIESLQAKGRAIELVTLSGVPRSEVLRMMGEIDVLVDQLVSGSFGLTAIEAMAMGRPVICYLHDGIQIFAPEECPVIRANPDTIEDVLAHLSHDQLEAAGRAGREYVKKYYSIAALAEHLSRLYSDFGVALPQTGRIRGFFNKIMSSSVLRRGKEYSR